MLCCLAVNSLNPKCCSMSRKINLNSATCSTCSPDISSCPRVFVQSSKHPFSPATLDPPGDSQMIQGMLGYAVYRASPAKSAGVCIGGFPPFSERHKALPLAVSRRKWAQLFTQANPDAHLHTPKPKAGVQQRAQGWFVSHVCLLLATALP